MTEGWNFAIGEEGSYLTFSLAVIGLAADIGAWSGVGTAVFAPVNLVVAVFKAVSKATPKSILRGVIRIADCASVFPCPAHMQPEWRELAHKSAECRGG